MLNPCCCLSPRIGALIFGIIDMLVALRLLFWEILKVGAVLYAWGVIASLLDHGFRGEMIGEIIICVCLLTMAFLLLFGAWKNEAEKIRMWLILWIVFLVITVAFQVFNIYSHRGLNNRLGGSIGALALMIYQVWVVYAYLVELRSGPGGLTYCPTQITV